MSTDSYFFCTFAADMKKGILKNQKKGLSKSAPKSVTTAKSIVTDTEFVQQAILSRLSTLETKVKDLSSDNSRKERHIQSLQKQLHDVKQENKKLKNENKRLRSQVEKLSGGSTPTLNSQNSSTPPSKDTITNSQARARRTSSLREKSDRHIGGQPGHKGATLHQSEHVDKVEVANLATCPDCGANISKVEGKVAERRQVIDITLSRKWITEYISFEKECPVCGKKVRAPFPEGVNAPVCYGANLKAMVVYLVEEMNASTNKVKSFLSEVFSIDLCEATICNMVQDVKRRGLPAYKKIHDMMLDEEVVGGDETTENINGVLKWLWTWRSERLTYLAGGKGRGPKDFDSEYSDGFPKSTFVSDRLPLYYNVVAEGHQICIAHLLRNLLYLDQLAPMQDWSKRMQELLRDAIRQRKHIDWVDIDREDIVKRFEKLLDEPLDKLNIEFRRLQNSLRKWKDAVFTFLYNKKVPSDNNGSEREIRKAKIKMKVSQCFRSFKGAEAFDVLHSLMDTAKKNGQSPFNVIRTIAYPKAMVDDAFLTL